MIRKLNSAQDDWQTKTHPRNAILTATVEKDTPPGGGVYVVVESISLGDHEDHKSSKNVFVFRSLIEVN